MTDEYAGYVMRELQARGIRIPDEIAVIGHGNDRFAEIVNPALASIDDDLAAQGRGAVELLLRMIDAADENPAAGALHHDSSTSDLAALRR